MAADICVRRPVGDLWIEVKFNKATARGAKLSDAARFGHLLNDFIRAGLFPKGSGIVVGVTDDPAASFLERLSQSTPFHIDEGFVAALPPPVAKAIKVDLKRAGGTRASPRKEFGCRTL